MQTSIQILPQIGQSSILNILTKLLNKQSPPNYLSNFQPNITRAFTKKPIVTIKNSSWQSHSDPLNPFPIVTEIIAKKPGNYTDSTDRKTVENHKPARIQDLQEITKFEKRKILEERILRFYWNWRFAGERLWNNGWWLRGKSRNLRRVHLEGILRKRNRLEVNTIDGGLERKERILLRR